MAKEIVIKLDNGYSAKVNKWDNKITLRLMEQGGQSTGYVELSIDDNTALRRALMHFL